MRTYKRRITVCLLMLMLTFGSSVFVGAAEDETSLAEDISGKLSDIAADVYEHSGSSLASEAVGENIEESGQKLMELMKPERIAEEIAGTVGSALPEALSLLAVISGLVIISAVCTHIAEGMTSGSLAAGFGFCSAAAIITAIVSVQYGIIERVGTFFDRLSSLMGSMIPITGVVWAMGGNVGTASVGTAALYALLTATQKLCAETVFPVCYVMGMSAMCAGLSGGGMLAGFTGAVKKTYNFFVAALMTVLVFALGAQTTIAISADTAAARGAKLLSSTVIPVVGGAVGDTLRTVAGSVQYVKSVVGIGGILFVLAVTLPTLISLLLFRLVFLLTGSMAEALGCQRESRLLSELGNVYGCLVGAVAICSVAFAVALGIFVKCAVAVA